ncbi:MAG: type II toxin-antitoxin system RelE/ParE family toxin [Pseudomonadota bacterium]
MPRQVVRLPEELAVLVRSMHPDMKKLFKLAFSMLVADPHCGKILREELAGLRTLRVKNMRIVYRLSARKVVEVVAIGPRTTIYEETFRLIGGK